MKTKFILALFTLTTLVIVFITEKFKNDDLSITPKAEMKIIKCSSTNFLLNDIDTTQQIAPLFDDLGKHYYKISTTNSKAQIFFNQGLNLTYAFNYFTGNSVAG